MFDFKLHSLQCIPSVLPCAGSIPVRNGV